MSQRRATVPGSPLVRAWALVVLGAALAAPAARAAELTVYYSWSDAEAAAVLDAFEARHGVSVRRMRRSTRTVVKQLELEQDDPVASVMLGGPVAAYEMGAAAGVYAPYTPAGEEVLSPELLDPDHLWHAIQAGVIGFGTDPDSGLEPPRSWEDLRSARYADQVIYGDPTTSGTGYTIVSTLVALYGEEGAFRYLTELDDNVAYYPEGGAMAAHLARLSIGGVAVAFLHDLAGTTPRAGDKRLILTVPEEGTGWEIGGAALVRGAPDPAGGRALLDFLQTPEAQEILWREVGIPMYPVHPDATPSPDVPPLDSFLRVPLDFEQVGRSWDRMAARWTVEVGGRRVGRR